MGQLAVRAQRLCSLAGSDQLRNDGRKAKVKEAPQQGSGAGVLAQQHAAHSAVMSSGNKEFDHWPGSQAAVSECKEMAKLLRAKQQRAELKAVRSRQSQEVFQSLVQHHRNGQAMQDCERCTGEVGAAVSSR